MHFQRMLWLHSVVWSYVAAVLIGVDAVDHVDYFTIAYFASLLWSYSCSSCQDLLLSVFECLLDLNTAGCHESSAMQEETTLTPAWIYLEAQKGRAGEGRYTDGEERSGVELRRTQNDVT